MVSATNNENIAGPLARWWGWVKALPERFSNKVVKVAKMAKKQGQDDPRKIIHSLKVGLAITLVSLIYYFDPLYEGFGISAMWAVLSVIVVFEFSVGATFGRGLNRVTATFSAGFLGVGAHRLATLCGEPGEPILLGLFVFIIAAVVTFIRFFPRMKARYDYGLMIFILTFCLITVSGYRDDEVVDMAHKRLSAVLIGGATAVIICIFVYPVWAGDDLHNLVANNTNKLATFLDGFVEEYFKILGDGEIKENNASLQGYKSVLNSKGIEDSWANFAKWEPRHGQFKFCHPWKQYQKIGALTRQCAYIMEALYCYLDSEIHTPPAIRSKIQETCTEMGSECSKGLKELSTSIRTMTKPTLAEPHIANSRIAAKTLKSMLKSGLWEDADLLEIIPAATVASLLVDVVACTEKIAEAIQELASLAHFKTIDHKVTPEKSNLTHHQQTVHPCADMESPDHVITIDGSSTENRI